MLIVCANFNIISLNHSRVIKEFTNTICTRLLSTGRYVLMPLSSTSPFGLRRQLVASFIVCSIFDLVPKAYRRFCTRWNFPRGTELLFVFEPSVRTNSKKITKNFVPPYEKNTCQQGIQGSKECKVSNTDRLQSVLA